MTANATLDMTIGIAIPDTADELIQKWSKGEPLELIGHHTSKWLGRRRTRQTLHTWTVTGNPPFLLSWSVNVDCDATHVRFRGTERPMDEELIMFAGDELRLSVDS